MANQLANASSPYLLQHANNPVNWYPWGAEALQKAKAENKLILVSIGYSACHWCHVMEHESFEDDEVAALMNRFFVCIKVDREERPDIDQIYMTAVQLMTGRGGWPLNCFCLPDQRPIYGGTYFPKQDWMNILGNLAHFYETKPDEAEEYAVRLTEGIQQSEKLEFGSHQQEYTMATIQEFLEPWKRSFDFTEGGPNRAPKFPMPNNWEFLMQVAQLTQDNNLANFVKLTLDKMASGGLYDHLRGGFARYSVDAKWHIPHFEKMLYDNGQLLSLYSNAYKWTGNQSYKKVVYDTVNWLKNEMTSAEGGFFSALDADSEGVEGKFYTWAKAEIDEILGGDAPLFNSYYEISEKGNWAEEHTNHLWRRKPASAIATHFGVTEEAVEERITLAKQKLLAVQNQRVRPGLDDKILCSWNALTISGLCHAYQAFADEAFLNLAMRNLQFIDQNLNKENGGLYRNFKDGKTSINAFLDDYACLIQALIDVYECTSDEQHLQKAKALTNFVWVHFKDANSPMFFYTSDEDEALIARKYELLDNVIPASNSIMANNLKKLGLLLQNDEYLQQAADMLKSIVPSIKTYASGYSNWASLLLQEVKGVFEIAVTGDDFEEKRRELEKKYIPNKIILGGKQGNLPLLHDKFIGETRIFVCKDKTCQLPVSEVSEALKQIF